MQGKNVLLIATVRATTLRLSQYGCTTHTQFRILVHGYLSTLSKPSNILQTLKNVHVIIIDEMSTVISTMLCAII
jgi:DNA replication protein DnaC